MKNKKTGFRVKSGITGENGFTLIELLVVIAIIGILATIATFSISSLRAKARDTERVTDIKRIQLTLENYYRDENSYPEFITFGSDLTGQHSSTTYLAPAPKNPAPQNDGNCSSSDYVYTKSNYYGYKIQFCLKSANGDIPAGHNCATAKGIMAGECPSCNDPISITSVAGYTCDPSHDRCIYDTVQIGGQCWMKQI